MVARYAVYYAAEPGSPLAEFGKHWLGRNGAPENAPLPNIPGISDARMHELTSGPRRYGFHGTLKPPFELHPATSLDSLLAAARIFAKSMAPVEMPALELAIIGKFIALTPITSSAALENLAAKCVRAFEGYRMPLTDQQIAHYRNNKLTVHQNSMLEHWGYPYVMEEFRFHISLTERIDDISERRAVMQVITEMAKDVVGKPLTIRDIAVFGQEERDQPMTVIERLPFGRAN
ncbi:MAG: DUF1045 domain-containing protein [Rhodobacteraceae bacterium]|nr:DUF1045 domain-containing protein [Paracoccaceae bacterium]